MPIRRKTTIQSIKKFGGGGGTTSPPPVATSLWKRLGTQLYKVCDDNRKHKKEHFINSTFATSQDSSYTYMRIPDMADLIKTMINY